MSELDPTNPVPRKVERPTTVDAVKIRPIQARYDLETSRIMVTLEYLDNRGGLINKNTVSLDGAGATDDLNQRGLLQRLQSAGKLPPGTVT